MDPRKTAQILLDVYGDNALPVALRWCERSRSAANFWSLVAEELRSRLAPADGMAASA
jgi:hypothetical protein